MVTTVPRAMLDNQAPARLGRAQEPLGPEDMDRQVFQA